MEHRSLHEKTTSGKLTIVVLSDAEKPSRSFKTSKSRLALIVLFGFVAIAALSTIGLIYTPLGRLVLPNYFSTQAEQLAKVQALESKVESVQKQLTYLAAYNMKLRNALGDTLTSGATEVAVSGQATSSQAERIIQEQATKQTPNEYADTYQPASSGGYASALSKGDASSVFPLILPVSGFVTRGVDYSAQHYGVDISAPKGEPIVAPAPGEVLFSDWTLTGGNTLIIAHADNIVTVYKHCERILVSVGTRVSRGEAIALVGSTGVTSTGPHLHFELWQDGRNLNPQNYLLAKN